MGAAVIPSIDRLSIDACVSSILLDPHPTHIRTGVELPQQLNSGSIGYRIADGWLASYPSSQSIKRSEPQRTQKGQQQQQQPWRRAWSW